MKAREVMTWPVATVPVDASLAQAASQMRDHDCGAVVVRRSDGEVVAMLTDRDICMEALRAGKPLADLCVDRAMSRELHSCGPDDDLAQIENTMALHRVRRLPVLDEQRRIVGVVSLDRLARIASVESHMKLFAPHIAEAEVGDLLGDICRPRLAGCDEDEAREAKGDRR